MKQETYSLDTLSRLDASMRMGPSETNHRRPVNWWAVISPAAKKGAVWLRAKRYVVQIDGGTLRVNITTQSFNSNAGSIDGSVSVFASGGAIRNEQCRWRRIALSSPTNCERAIEFENISGVWEECCKNGG